MPKTFATRTSKDGGGGGGHKIPIHLVTPCFSSGVSKLGPMHCHTCSNADTKRAFYRSMRSFNNPTV